MTLHVLALFLHTICMMFFQIGRVYYFKSIGTDSEQTWATIWNWGRLAMYLSGVISEIIVIYLFLEFSTPVSLKKVKEKEEEEEDYEEEFDRIRDPNVDMMYFVKTANQAPKMKRIRDDINYDIDNEKGAAEYLFDDQDAPSVWNVDESEFDDAEIDKFTDSCSVAWGGEEESQLRMAVFVAFVNNKDTVNLKKKAKKNRKEVIRRASVNNPDELGLDPLQGRSARRFSDFKKSVQGPSHNQSLL